MRPDIRIVGVPLPANATCPMPVLTPGTSFDMHEVPRSVALPVLANDGRGLSQQNAETGGQTATWVVVVYAGSGSSAGNIPC